MAVEETPALSLAEKQARAQKLILEVKEYSQKTTEETDGEEFAAQKGKVSEAQRLMTEVKSEKLAIEKSELVELLEQAQKGIESFSTPDSATVDVAKQRIADITDLAAKGYGSAQKQDESYETMSTKQRLVISDARFTKQLFNGFKPQNFQKANTEGTGSAGGYLVVPEYLQDMFAAVRGQGNALRRFGWLNIHPTTSNQVIIPLGSSATAVGWTAELATKTTADLAFGQLTVNIFTLAGLAYASLQMLNDSDPAIADLALQDLSLRLGNAEEIAIIAGTGSNQPLGILGTSGINDRSTQITTSPTGQSVVDGLLDCIMDIQTNYFAPPTGILMHPRRLSWLQKTKDSTNNYIWNAAQTFRAPGGFARAGEGNLGVTSQSVGGNQMMPDLFGLPIGVSTNVPTNRTYGSGTNEDVIIVGNWNEAHFFQRQEVTVDSTTEGAGTFETNQIAFRVEERGGFTAARFPRAMAILGGPGLT